MTFVTLAKPEDDVGASKHVAVLSIYTILLMYVCCAFVGLDNKQLSVTDDTCHTNALLRYSAQTVCTHFKHYKRRTQSSPLWSSVNKPAQYKYSTSSSTSLSFPHPSSSSDPEETPNLFDGVIGGFISLLPVFTTGLIGIFPYRKGVLLLHTVFLANGLKKGLFLACLGRLHLPLLSSLIPPCIDRWL